MSNQRKMIVTNALTYANGPIHLGHLVEAIQADIWVRFHRLCGRDCLFVGGDDAHGTPIMLQAQKREITPEALIAEIYEEHRQTYQRFLVSHDVYHTTHSDENQTLVKAIYEKLKVRGDIETKTIKQAFDNEKQMFLPDRFVKGHCPRCQAADQNGDNCEVCGATYSPTELKNPISVLSGTTPIFKNSEHLFFTLDHYRDFLKEWLTTHVPLSMQHKLNEWFAAGLQSWCISRDAPYFGFAIPDEPNKFFYVWLDAPIGYMAATQHYCTQHQQNFSAYWNADSQADLYHFIGKDIVYFHALFWPAMLHGSNHRTPTQLFVHGFLTINGLKMSKSRGTFIQGKTYLDFLPAEYLRYFYAAKLNDGVADIDLNLEEFRHKINADLIGKVVNIASRAAPFITKYHDNTLASTLPNNALWQTFTEKQTVIASAYRACDFAKAIREMMALADLANQYIDQEKPWALIKQTETAAQVQGVATLALNLFRLLMLWLKPVLPITSAAAEKFLNIPPMIWQDGEKPLLDHRIEPYQMLLTRIEEQTMTDLQQTLQNETTPLKTETAIENTSISIDEFMKIDLRIGKIIQAEAIAEADKLVKLQIDVGEAQPRQIFAGIKQAYSPENLLGKMVVVVANLAPRKMRFGISEGMVLAAGPGGKDIWVVTPEPGAKPGDRVK